MRKALLLSIAFVAGYFLSYLRSPGDETAYAISQHTEILVAITSYVAELQEKGVLPLPEKKGE